MTAARSAPYDGYTGAFNGLNSAGLNPNDNKAYASMVGPIASGFGPLAAAGNTGSGRQPYLVRFDQHTIQFVAPLQHPFWVAGTFDDEGTYM